MDVTSDVEAILAGKAMRTGNDVVINGRTYGIEENGTLFPRQGPGFIQLDRAAFKALGVYNVHGESAFAEEILQRMKGQTRASRTAGLAAHRAGKQQ